MSLPTLKFRRTRARAADAATGGPACAKRWTYRKRLVRAAWTRGALIESAVALTRKVKAMPDGAARFEVIRVVRRRRCWTSEQKPALIQEIETGGTSLVWREPQPTVRVAAPAARGQPPWCFASRRCAASVIRASASHRERPGRPKRNSVFVSFTCCCSASCARAIVELGREPINGAAGLCGGAKVCA